MMALIFSAALKGTVLLALASVATLMLRRSSSDLRHRIWLAAICGVPLLMIPLKSPEVVRSEFFYSITTGANTVAAASPVVDWPVVWAIGFALIALRFAVGVAQMYFVTRRAVREDGLLLSEEVGTPLTWGRAIVLPTYAREWSSEKLAIALAHERAHIAQIGRAHV